MAAPLNIGYNCDLSIIHRKLEDVLFAQRDLNGAPAAFSTSLAVADRRPLPISKPQSPFGASSRSFRY